MKSVSIIFPAYNHWPITKKCLESLMRLNYPKELLEIIVVDNHSSDDTPEKIKKNFPQVKILAQKTNLRFARAMNLASKKAHGEYLFITNNDVTLTPNFLTILLNFMSSDPHIGVTGGKIITTARGRTFPDGGTNVSFISSSIKRLNNYNKQQQVDYICGAGMLVRKKIFDLVGGFDINYPFYFDDLDLCIRIKKLGLTVIYFPKAIMYHQQSSTVKSFAPEWFVNVWLKGKIRLIRKHFPYWAKPIALTSQFLFTLLVLATKGQNQFPLLLKAFRFSRVNKQRAITKRNNITKKQIQNYYEKGNVFTARNSAPFQQVVLKDFYQLLTTNYPTKSWHILEFGVGHGWNLPQMVKYFGKITAVDVTQIALEESIEYGFKNVIFEKVSAGKLPVKNNTFDLIVACEVLEHVPDLDITSKELRRITKPGGFILVSVPVYLNLRGISKIFMESILGRGTWEPARSHPGGFERLLTPGKILSYFSDFKIIDTRGADYGTAWSLPTIPLYPQSCAPFFEVTLGKLPIIKNFGMNYYFLAQKT